MPSSSSYLMLQVESMQGIIFVEKTSTSSQYFYDLQNFAAITLGMTLIPVTTQTEAAGILIQLVDNIFYGRCTFLIC